MPQGDNTTTLTNLQANPAFSPGFADIDGKRIDYWDFNDAPQHLAYYKTIPNYKKAIDKLAIWSVGKGFETNNAAKPKLNGITGYGEDTFLSIMWNLLISKKIFGDAFAEIIRADNNPRGELLNLKPLYTGDMRINFNKKGVIEGYRYRTNEGDFQDFQPNEIFHIVNDRIADEKHGTPAIEACKWIIDAREEALNTWRKLVNRSPIRVLYVSDLASTSTTTLANQYKEGIKKGEVIIFEGKKGDIDFDDLNVPPIDSFIRWIEYLDNALYQAVGTPRTIMDVGGITEAGNKVGYLTFEPDYTWEQTQLERDLWNQLAIKGKFNRPPSLHGVVSEDEQKNTGQTGIQPNEVTAAAGRVE